MGKATIIAEGEAEGAYTVRADFGSDIIAARIAVLEARAAALQSSIDAKETEKTAALAESFAKSSAMSSTINAYRAKLATEEDASEELKAVTDAQAVLVAAQINLGVIENDYDSLVIRRSAVVDRIAFLNGLDLQQDIDTWCVDYTLEADGVVATIEVPGEPAKVLVAPGAPSPTIADGTVLARPVMDSKELYYNLAILPGWQKFKPTYRVGVLTAIDYETDTCDVTLDAAASTAQALDINQALFLEDVPIEYMDCDGGVFEVDDRVVVKFANQDWEQPKVIGFESNPRPCWDAIGRIWKEGTYTQFGTMYTELHTSSRDNHEELVEIVGEVLEFLENPATGAVDVEVFIKHQDESTWTQLDGPFGVNPGDELQFGFFFRYREEVSGFDNRDEYHLFFATPDDRPNRYNFPEPFRFYMQIWERRFFFEPGSEIPDANYQDNLPGIFECLVRRISTGAILHHIAVDFDNRAIKAVTTQFIDPIKRTITGVVAPTEGPLPDFSLDVLDFALSDPPE